ncbi:uncharacterized protein TM35_000053720 [Trypanosoma theileri]|uniref:Uncharacterized protein n=1 Tax=Trypanosoma theileri TaxID=67003 RepID=A0A1X0P4B8_9TRYP|nr:uncharacterized protein TM35_000053720 [Trypanosoma theileri]ORC91776.1 hypothetical protein TM35_000053720 [Trypanosoma theileri]
MIKANSAMVMLRRSATAMRGVKRKCRKGKISTKRTLSPIRTSCPIGILVCWHPTARPTTTMCEVRLASLKRWKCVSCAPRQGGPHCQRRAAVGIRGPRRLPQDVGKKKKLRRARHPGFQYHH